MGGHVSKLAAFGSENSVNITPARSSPVAWSGGITGFAAPESALTSFSRSRSFFLDFGGSYGMARAHDQPKPHSLMGKGALRMTDEDDNYDPSDETDAPVSDSNWMRSSDEQVAARAIPGGDADGTGWATGDAAVASQTQESAYPWQSPRSLSIPWARPKKLPAKDSPMHSARQPRSSPYPISQNSEPRPRTERPRLAPAGPWPQRRR